MVEAWLSKLSVKECKKLLRAKGVNSSTCVEKSQLVALVGEHVKEGECERLLNSWAAAKATAAAGSSSGGGGGGGMGARPLIQTPEEAAAWDAKEAALKAKRAEREAAQQPRRLEPETGRYHQLRRHLALELAGPILGDKQYLSGEARAAELGDVQLGQRGSAEIESEQARGVAAEDEALLVSGQEVAVQTDQVDRLTVGAPCTHPVRAIAAPQQLLGAHRVAQLPQLCLTLWIGVRRRRPLRRDQQLAEHIVAA